MTKDEGIELMRQAAAKLDAAGLEDIAWGVYVEATQLEENPDEALLPTDTRLHFALTVDNYIAFCRMVGAIPPAQ